MTDKRIKHIRECRWPRLASGLTVREESAKFAQGYNIPYAKPLKDYTAKELFEADSRLTLLIGNLDRTIYALAASGTEDDIRLAAQIQHYKFQKESELVAVRAQIIATRR